VELDEEITSPSTKEPTCAPPSPKPITPPPQLIPSPSLSPIHYTPPLLDTQASPPHTSHGFDASANPFIVPTVTFDSLLTKLNDFQSRFFAFQDEVRVSLASITDHLT
jgi:hypothetical protein